MKKNKSKWSLLIFETEKAVEELTVEEFKKELEECFDAELMLIEHKLLLMKNNWQVWKDEFQFEQKLEAVARALS